MTIVEVKLTDAYAVLIMANKYILREDDRTNITQKLVPEKVITEIEIKVAERTIEKLYQQPLESSS